jgi:hypothetical protein
MNTTAFRAFFTTLFAALLAAPGCGDDAPVRPEQSRSVVSDQDLARIEARGVPIYGGLTPPDASGTYLHDSIAALDTINQGEVSSRFCDMRVSLVLDGKQTVRRTVTFTGSNCGEPEETAGIFISGSGDCFTLYGKSENAMDGCAVSTVSVTSACVRAGGLFEFREGFSDTAHQGAGCPSMVDNGRLMPLGGVVVFQEADGLVARVE